MTTRRYVLALDQGTTGSTALVVDPDGRVRARGYAELPQYFPRPGWVEHDPEEIWATVERAARAALAEARIVGAEVAAIGITNQRETTIVWDRASGDRKSTRLNSSHLVISYAVFCLKKKNNKHHSSRCISVQSSCVHA